MRGAEKPTCWRVAEATVDTARHRVLVAGVPRDLEPLSFRLLLFLIEHRDHVASKEEILAAVWNDTIVSDNALSRAIALIRKVLGDDPKQPRYVKTVPRVGYHLIAEVEEVAPAVAVPSSAGREAFAGDEDRGEEPSIAVVPFANLSADEENEYIADGLAEEILNSLARIPDLKVIARTSSFAFRGTAQGIASIAAALRVRYVLEGSVRRAGNRIRVTAQLIDAVDGIAPVERILRKLAEKQYNGPLSVELFRQQFVSGEPFKVATEIRQKCESVMRQAQVL
jgi:TolB-like protein